MNTLKLLKKMFALTALPMAIALTAATPGCGMMGNGPSEVGQGRRFQTGDPTYDDFFAAVHELQLSMGDAPAAEKKVRIDLGKKLGVEPEEDDEPTPAPAAANAAQPEQPTAADQQQAQLENQGIAMVPGGSTALAVQQQVDQAKQSVNQLKSIFSGFKTSSDSPATAPSAAPVKKGPKAPSAALLAKAVKSKSKKLNIEMKLRVDRKGIDDGDAKAKVELGGEDPELEGRKLGDLVASAAKSELDLVGKMKLAKRKLTKLGGLGAALEANVDTSFRKAGMGKKAEVRKNLEDARALIKLMDARADEVAAKAGQLVAKLEDAASAVLPEPGAETESAVAKTEPEAKPAALPKAPESKASEPKAKSTPADKPKASERPKASRPAAPARKPVPDFEP